MSMHQSHGPHDSGDVLGDFVYLVTSLWRFFTQNTVGIAIALAFIAYLIFSFSLFAIPRATLSMAQTHEGEGDEEKDRKDDSGDKACLALVVEVREDCLGDPALDPAEGDGFGLRYDETTPAAMFAESSDNFDGYFDHYYGPTVVSWQTGAADPAVDAARRESRRCITQLITKRWNETLYARNNTFAAFSGQLQERNVLKDQIGWWIMPIVRLNAPDYNFDLAGMSFAPLRPGEVEKSCRPNPWADTP